MRRLLIAIAILAGLGVVVSSYGLWQHYAPLGAAFCNINESFSCDIVNKSAYSEIAGVPVALAGIVGYAVLAIIAIIAARGARTIAHGSEDWNEHRESLVILLASALIGFLFQAALTVVELWWIGAYCPICIASQVIILTITILACIVCRHGSHRLEQSS